MNETKWFFHYLFKYTIPKSIDKIFWILFVSQKTKDKFREPESKPLTIDDIKKFMEEN